MIDCTLGEEEGEVWLHYSMIDNEVSVPNLCFVLIPLPLKKISVRNPWSVI
jgi:hypothetical protein